MAWAEECRADVLLLPELAITGYPPEDLVLREGFVNANIEALHRLAKTAGNTTTVVGFVDRSSLPPDDAGHVRVHNAAALIERGRYAGSITSVACPTTGFSMRIDTLRWAVTPVRCGRSTGWSLVSRCVKTSGYPMGLRRSRRPTAPTYSSTSMAPRITGAGPGA